MHRREKNICNLTYELGTLIHHFFASSCTTNPRGLNFFMIAELMVWPGSSSRLQMSRRLHPGFSAMSNRTIFSNTFKGGCAVLFMRYTISIAFERSVHASRGAVVRGTSAICLFSKISLITRMCSRSFVNYAQKRSIFFSPDQKWNCARESPFFSCDGQSHEKTGVWKMCTFLVLFYRECVAWYCLTWKNGKRARRRVVQFWRRS